MNKAFVTIAIPIPQCKAEQVRTLVRGLNKTTAEMVRERIDQIGTIHFLSMTVVAEDAPWAHLLVTLTADGDARTAAQDIAHAMEPDLGQILQAARVRNAALDPAGVLQRYSYVFDTSLTGGLWLGRMVGLPFDGLPSMTVTRIRQERDLAARLIASGTLNGPATALAKLEKARKAVYADGDKRWAFEALPVPFLGPSRSVSIVTGAKMSVGGLLPLLWPLLLIPVAAALWGSPVSFLDRTGFTLITTILAWPLLGFLAWRKLRRAEAEAPDDTPPNPDKIAKILERENDGRLNLLITVSKLKPGWFRKLTLRLAFRAIEQFVKHAGRPGFLGGNGEIGSLHSGRWLVLPDTDLLMFVAHYDGSWLSYMQDFVDLMTLAPTAIWSNTEGFPRTRALFQEGVADGDRATRWFHRQQREVDFCYAALPDLTLGQIRANAAIRHGFAAVRTAPEAEAWLALFGAPTPKPIATLPRCGSGVTTLAYGALAHRRHAACVALRFEGDAGSSRAWLESLQSRISYGWAKRSITGNETHDKHEGELPPDHVLAIACSGLRKLGVGAKDLATFPAPFVNGMDSPGRAKLLGDKPDAWEWGHAKNPADAVLLVYACSRATLERAIDAATNGAVDAIRTIYCQPRDKSGEMVEPFGFRDGLSQPVIPGTPAFERGPAADQVVGPGEFVLGFPDDSGLLPPVPTVDSASDVKNSLPKLPGGRADIGYGSSFLVIRQLAQDCQSFDAFTSKLAHELRVSKELAAAKIIGRWKNGSSLVRNPTKPGPAPDNDFRFMSEDPDGLGCPKGAHIRRANPRDAIHPGATAAAKPLNRRRLLRVGRPYLDSCGLDAGGTLFMCINADIERQFELVQQAWLLNPDFGDLRDETDPLIGSAPASESRPFTIPQSHGPYRACGLLDFVKMLGGGYFWLPSRDAVNYLVVLHSANGTQTKLPTVACLAPTSQ